MQNNGRCQTSLLLFFLCYLVFFGFGKASLYLVMLITMHVFHVSDCTLSVRLCCFFCCRKSSIASVLLRAMTSDASQSNNIQGLVFYNILYVGIEAFGTLLCSFSYILPLLSSLATPLPRSITGRKCFL